MRRAQCSSYEKLNERLGALAAVGGRLLSRYFAPGIAPLQSLRPAQRARRLGPASQSGTSRANRLLMSEHTATILWKRSSEYFHADTFSRAHTWTFDSGVVVPATSAPAFHGDLERVDPEEAFVAALSSCHMLTFLAIAARKRFVVEQYTDHALGTLNKNERGKLWIDRVTLRPKVVFSGEQRPTAAEVSAMHHSAHENCFIALSARSEVIVEPQ